MSQPWDPEFFLREEKKAKTSRRKSVIRTVDNIVAGTAMVLCIYALVVKQAVKHHR